MAERNQPAAQNKMIGLKHLGLIMELLAALYP
jgi:hypothetical protein